MSQVKEKKREGGWNRTYVAILTHLLCDCKKRDRSKELKVSDHLYQKENIAVQCVRACVCVCL